MGLFSPEEYSLICSAIRQLSSMCDYASTKDGVGFNKSDATAGHHLAALPSPNWTENDHLFSWSILFKYRHQLSQLCNISIERLYSSRLTQRNNETPSTTSLQHENVHAISQALSKVRSRVKSKISSTTIVDFRPADHLFTLKPMHPITDVRALAMLGLMQVQNNDHEVYTDYAIHARFSVGLKQLTKYLASCGSITVTPSAVTRMETPAECDISLAKLTEMGFDQRNLIALEFKEHIPYVAITCEPNDKRVLALSRYHYDAVLCVAEGAVVFPCDLKMIKNLMTHNGYLCHFNHRPHSYTQINQIISNSPFKPEVSVSTEHDTVIIHDPANFINLDSLKTPYVSIRHCSPNIYLKPSSTQGVRNLGTILSAHRLKVPESTIPRKVASETPQPKKPQANGGHHYYHLETDGLNYLFWLDQFDHSVVEFIKKTYPSTQRKFIKEASRALWSFSVDSDLSLLVNFLKCNTRFKLK